MKSAFILAGGFFLTTLIPNTQAQTQTNESLFFTSTQLLPPNGMYIAPATSSVGLPAVGVIISNFVHRSFTLTTVPPPVGTSSIFSYNSQVEFDMSINGGGTFTHVSLPATEQLTISGNAPGPTSQTYNLEILALTISGNLPGNVMLRESPNRASLGTATVQSGAGGFGISSSFDIFFDVSLNGGQTWTPISSSQHVDLRVDPQTIVSVPETTALMPPPDDQIAMRPQDVVSYTGPTRVKGLKASVFSTAIDGSQLVPGAQAVSLPFTANGELQVSLDGGQTYTSWQGPITFTATVLKTRAGQTHLFETELSQMDITITGNFPSTLKLRESPTLHSYGGTMIRQLSGGTFETSSFFDIYTELSTDGGQTWTPASSGPMHVEIQGNSQRNVYASSNFPVENSQYVVPPGLVRSYQTGGNGLLINGLTFSGFTQSFPLPPVGSQSTFNFNGQATVSMSFNGGLQNTITVAQVTWTVKVQRSAITGPGGVTFYDAQVTQLTFNGLPNGLMLRASTSLASQGRLSVFAIPGGGFYMDSFFNLFTEASMDGGQSWHSAAEGSAVIGTIPFPMEAPLKIGCPEDIYTTATSSSGAVVTFSFGINPGDCPPLTPPTLTAMPPSGSTFPIGTTTVTCSAHDVCGEFVSCTFKVHVLPYISIVPSHLVDVVLFPPPKGTFLSPPQFGPISAGGLVINNLAFSQFLNSVTPPQVGSSIANTVTFTATLDWSLNGSAFTHGTATGEMVLSLENLGAGTLPGQEIHQMQIVSLTISGGTLPQGVMIRQSGTKPSLGQTQVTISGNNTMMGSFFDVFTEITTDGGVWIPADQSAHLELGVDGGGLANSPQFTPLSPSPDDEFITGAGTVVTFTGGVRIQNLRQTLPSQTFDATLLNGNLVPAVQRFSAQMDLQWSTDGGQTYTSGRAPVNVGLTIRKAGELGAHYYDTELVQLDIAGGDLPATIKFRESPTLSSYGQSELLTITDGTFTVTSFFDVFLEVSTDGGNTWQPSQSGPVHFEQNANGLRMHVAASQFPPPGGEFAWPSGSQQTYIPNGIIVVLQGDILHNFNQSFATPPPGQSSTQDYTGTTDVQISTDGGNTFNSYTGNTTGTFKITGNTSINWGDSQVFDTEMLSMNVSGGNLPTGMMLRESPTKSSLGRATYLPDVGGVFRVDSFFDVFTELSTDAGRTWNASQSRAVPSTLQNQPPYAPYGVTCPANITVTATTPKGAIVNYSIPPLVPPFPDCPLCCFTASGSPASGSLFPIGTTTVTVTGHDGCGEHPTCTFTVTVVQPPFYVGLALQPIGGIVIGPVLLVTNDLPPPVTFSNVSTTFADGIFMNFGMVKGEVKDFAGITSSTFSDILFTAIGPLGSNASTTLNTSEFIGGTAPKIRADFSYIGSVSNTVLVRDDQHNRIMSTVLSNNQFLDINSLFPASCGAIATTVQSYWEGPDFAWYRLRRYGCNCTGSNCFTERDVTFRALNPTAGQPLFISGQNIHLAATTSPGSFTVLSEEMSEFGNLHEVLGNATFETGGDGLLAADTIGGSGGDGLMINLNSARGLTLSLSPLRMANASCLNLSAVGDVNGISGNLIGGLSLADLNGNGQVQISGNFNALTVTVVRVEIYLSGNFQGFANLPVNQPFGTLTLNGNLIGTGVLGQPLGGLWARFDAPFTFITSGNQGFTGDEIRVLPGNPTKQARSLSQFSLQGCSLGQIAVVGESVPLSLGTIAGFADGSVRITGQGFPGTTYRLQATGTLSGQPAWSTVNSVQADPDGFFDFTDPNLQKPNQQFYRVVTP